MSDAERLVGVDVSVYLAGLVAEKFEIELVVKVLLRGFRSYINIPPTTPRVSGASIRARTVRSNPRPTENDLLLMRSVP